MSNTSHLDRSTGALARALAAAHGPLGEGARLHTLDHLALVRGGAAVDAGAAPQLVSAQLRGRLVELSAQGASATLTAAVGLVVQCQRDGEPAAWITRADAAFYPPDLADSGVDLGALVVVRVAPSEPAPGPGRAAAPLATGPADRAGRAAEQLLRSGGFGLIVLDLGELDEPGATVAGASGRGRERERAAGVLGRLAGLAKQHDTIVAVLTTKGASAPSLGSLISLRAEALRVHDGGRFGVRAHALKDKQRGPGWAHVEPVRPPAGLRPRPGSR